jgi:hypothetical protein
MRALEIEKIPDIEAIDGAYRSREAALHIAMLEATGRDPALFIIGAFDSTNKSRVIEEMRKETGLDYVTMAHFCGASFSDKREREEGSLK